MPCRRPIPSEAARGRCRAALDRLPAPQSLIAVSLRAAGTRLAAYLLLSGALLLAPATAPLPFALPGQTGRSAGRAADAQEPRPAQARAESAALVGAVEAVAITVAEVERSVDFFSKVLSFEKVSDMEVAGEEYERLQGVFGLRLRVVRMRLGEESIELCEYLAPRGRPLPPDSRSNDLWFQHIAIVVSDMDRAYRWLRQNRVEHASSGPQRLPVWNEAAAGIRAFYFKDPDGHPLEILEFPEGKGDPKWRRRADRLFMGIDHTAVVAGDTERSLAFYRDLLGLRVAGESENYGTEQEHLNSVFGARLRITGLRAASGPGIELLEYLSPRGGRPRPPDARPNDLIHWQTKMVVTDAGAAARTLLSEGAAFISPGAVRTARAELGFRAGLTLGDPDGHALQLIERPPR